MEADEGEIRLGEEPHNPDRCYFRPPLEHVPVTAENSAVADGTRPIRKVGDVCTSEGGVGRRDWRRAQALQRRTGMKIPRGAATRCILTVPPQYTALQS